MPITISAVSANFDDIINSGEKAATVTISGTMTLGATVDLTFDGAAKSGTMSYGAGTWSYILQAADYLAMLEGAATIVATASDASVATRYITVDTLAPTATAAITSVVDNKGLIQGNLVSMGVNVTDDVTPTLSGVITGSMSSGDVLAVYDGATRLGNATVNTAANTWSYTDGQTRTLTNGKVMKYTVRVEDLAGNTPGASSSPAVVASIDTLRPSAIVKVNDIWDDLAPVGAPGVPVTVVHGGSTNDGTPQIRGTIVSGALGTGETVHVYRGTLDLGTATVTGTTWTFDDKSGSLVNGTMYRYTARVVDAAGNSGVSNEAYTVTYDTTVASPVFTGINQDLGRSTTDQVTSDTGLFLSGTGEAGATVTVRLGATYAGSAVLGTALVDGIGRWVFDYTATALGNATHSFWATQTDQAGNVSNPTAAYTVIVDTAAPLTTTVISAVTDDAGVTKGDLIDIATGYTDDVELVLSGSISVGLAAGEVVGVYDGTTRLGTATMIDALNWTYTDATLLHGDSVSYTAKVEDLAGNGLSSAAFTTIIDTQPSEETTTITVVDNVGAIQGNLASGSTTDDTSLVLTGSLASPLLTGEKLAIYDGTSKLGTAVVTVTDVYEGTTLVSQNVTWVYTDNAANGTTRNYTALVEDTAGNQGVASPVFVATVDTTLPVTVATISAVTDNAAQITGTVPTFGTTNDLTPDISGIDTLAAGESVHVFRDGVDIGSSTVSGAWSVADTLPGDGTYVYTARVMDAAGNGPAAVGSYTITADGTKPDPVLTSRTTTSIDFTYSENLGATTPVAGDFTGKKNGVALTLSAPAIGTNKLTLTTATTAATDIIEVSYTPGTNLLQDAAGNEVGAFHYVSGGSGADNINATYYTAGADVIWGNAGADSLDGGGGDDTFAYANMAEFIAGGGAVVDTTVIGGAGTDKIQVAGVMTLTAANSMAKVNTTEQLVAAKQSAAAQAHSLVVNADANLSSINTIDLSGDRFATSSATVTLTGVTKDVMVKGVALGANSLTGGAGNDTLIGGAGADTMAGGTGYDSLSGAAGNDIFNFVAVTGLSNLDTVDGGAGNDTVALSGNTAFVAKNDFDNVSNIETITLGNTTTSVSITTKDALVSSGAVLTLTAALTAPATLDFNGSAETNGMFSITGGAGNDSITGGAGNDSIVSNLGDDVLDGSGGNDTFTFVAVTGLTKADKVNGGTGSDTVILTGNTAFATADYFDSVSNIETITLGNTTTAVTITTKDALVSGGSALSLLLGGAYTGLFTFDGTAETGGSFNLSSGTNNDSITGGAGNDSISSGTGKDTLAGGAGDDVFSFTAGGVGFSGNDFVNGGAGNDTVALTSGAVGSGDFGNTTNIERITVDNTITTVAITTTDALVASGAVLTMSTALATGALTFVGTAETNASFSITGGGTNDTITGGAGADTLTGGAGVDSLTGNAGDDTFAFTNIGEFIAVGGAVVDTTVAGGAGTDRIQVAGGITLNAANSMATKVNLVEQLVAEKQSALNLTHSIVVTTAANLSSVTAFDLSGDTGATSKATIDLTGVATAMTLTGVNGASSTNTITGGSGNDTITGGAGVDVLNGGGGNNTFIYASLGEFIAVGGQVFDSITGGAGTADVIQVAGALTLTTANTLDRVFTTEQLVATAQSAAKQAHSIVLDTDAKLSSIRTIDLSGDTGAASSATVDLTGVTSALSMTIKGVANGVNSINGGAGNDSIISGLGKDTINSGSGADTIDSGAGDDYMTFAAGGLTSADFVDGGADIDTIELTGTAAIAAADFNNVKNVEIIKVAGYTNTNFNITTADQLVAAGAVLTLTNAGNAGTMNFNGANELNGAFSLVGGTSADTITGGAGNDTITGGTGVDIIDGKGGNDTFIYASLAEFISGGNVIDSITGDTGTDTIQIAGAIKLDTTDSLARVFTTEQLVAASSKADLINSIVLDTDIKLSSLRVFDFSANTGTSSAATVNLTGVSIAANMTITGLGGGTNSIIGGAGNDSITGGSGNDSLSGGTGGTDTLIGGAGNDIFTFATGALTSVDTVNGGTGSDTVALTGTTAIAAADFNGVSNIELITVANYTNTAFAITTLDALVAAGAVLKLSNANNAGNLVFNGAAELDGAFSITGGSGIDVFTGGAGNDTFTFVATTGLTSADTVNGGTGSDTVILTGNTAITTGTDFDKVSNIEAIKLGNFNTTVKITTQDTLVAANAILTLSNANNSAALTFDGSLETNGAFLITSGDGADVIKGGFLADTFTGGAGVDTLTGGAGDDVFTYDALADYYDSATDLVIDSIDGGAGTADKIQVAGSITFTTADTLASTRVLAVEQLVAAPQSLADLTHSIVLNTDAQMGATIRTIDLSADIGTNSTATINLTGVSAAVNMVLNGVGVGNSSIIGGAGIDTIIGGSGNDTIDGGGGNNTINGGGGNDSIIGGAGVETVDGGAGNDTINSGAGNDNLLGGDGDDTFMFAVGATGLTTADTVNGGLGSDTVALTGTAAFVTADFTNVSNIEAITVAEYTNTVFSFTTANQLVAAGAVLSLSNANNLGNMTFNGAAEADGAFSITGGKGNDTITGGAGNDTFTFAVGNLTSADSVSGGTGDLTKVDTIVLTGDVAITAGTEFNNCVNIEAIKLGNINTSVKIVTQEALVDKFYTLTLSAANMTASTVLDFNGALETKGYFSITGGAGNDIIVGGSAGSTIDGGAGNDTITGNAAGAADSMLGGAGNDTFSFVAGELDLTDSVDGGAGIDTLALTTNAKFNSGTDFDLVSNIEVITLQNTTAEAVIVTKDAMVASGATLTLTATGLTSGLLTFDGSAETNGFFSITGGGADDSISGGAKADTLTGGNGLDTITGGKGGDTINLVEGVASIDTIVILAGHSGAAGADKISGFAATATNNDELDLVTTTTTIGTTGTVTAVDVGIFMSHSVTAGIIKFDSVSQTYGAETVINTSNLADATAYLAWNVAGGTLAETVAFYVDADNSGGINAGDYLRVFQGGATALGEASTDDLYVDVYTLGVTALSATAAANTVVII